MELKRVNVASLTELLSQIEGLKNEATRIFVLFCGTVDPNTGTSWCSDCVKAEPVIEKVVLSNQENNGVLVTCSVGDKETWKDSNNPFRTDSNTKLTGVPTLVEWGTMKRLGPEECANEDLVRMLFEE